MALLLLTFPVSASDQGSILLKATAEDESTVYKLSNTEFMMYQVGAYKNQSWVLKKEFARAGVVFDFEDSSAQAEAAKKLEKGVYLFIQTNSTHIGDQVYQSEPFIITVTGYYDGQIIWDVTAEPKFKNESIPPITPNTPPVSEKTSGVGNNSGHTINVKTGDDTDIIRRLFLMGVSVAMFHIFRRKVGN